MNGVVVVVVQDRLADRHAGHRLPHPGPRAVAHRQPQRQRSRAERLVPGHRPERSGCGTSRCRSSTPSSWPRHLVPAWSTRPPAAHLRHRLQPRRHAAGVGAHRAAPVRLPASRRPRWPASPASCWPRTSAPARRRRATRYLLPAFAAVFLGATQLKNGRFNAWGTIIAVILLGTLTTGLGLAKVDQWVQQFATGVVLIAALALTGFQVRRAGSESRRATCPPARPPGVPVGTSAPPGAHRAAGQTVGLTGTRGGTQPAMQNLTRTGRRRRKLLLPGDPGRRRPSSPPACGDDDDSSSGADHHRRGGGATTTAAAAERRPPPPRRRDDDGGGRRRSEGAGPSQGDRRQVPPAADEHRPRHAGRQPRSRPA